MNKNIIPHRLKTARKIQGLSMEGLSRKMEGLISKQAISKYELGQMQPSDSVLEAMARALHVSTEYFFNQGKTISNIKFRIDPRMPAKSSAQMVSTTQDKLEHYLNIEELLAISTKVVNPLKRIKIRNRQDIERVAIKLREAWHLGNLPIFSVYEILESHGVKVIEFEAEISSILGFSTFAEDTIPLIVINLSANHTTERKRFTAMHELGHLFLHFDETLNESQCERFCNIFAAEVLCPASVVRRELGESRTALTLDELISLRNRYGISIAAGVHQAKDLGIITEAYYNEIFNVHIHKNRMEQGWGSYPIEEKTTRFERLLSRCVAEGHLTLEEAAHYSNEKPKCYKRKLIVL